MNSLRMWNVALLQRAVVPVAFIGALMIVLHLSIHELRNPFGLSLMALTALLLVLRPIDREIRWSSKFRTRVLLVGNQPFAQKFIEEIEGCPSRGYTIVGLVEETSSSHPQLSPYLVLGRISELQTIVASVKPHRIALTLSDRRGHMPVAELLEFQSQGIVVEDAVDAYENFSGKLAIEAVTPGHLISSRGLRKAPALVAMQRVLSLIAASVMLVVFAPILLLIALAVQLDSGGPVFFCQLRLGKRGRPFKLIKFRTMQPIDNPTSEWVQDNLKRITRVGKLLRRLRLDELPQLLNVIRGDMNLVGPRPHPVCNVKLFRDAIPYYVLRCSVLPGITGWAQTRYCYANNLDQETEKMRYDLYYIKHMSLWMDLRIMLGTGYVFVSSLLSTRSEPRAETKAVFKRHGTFIPVSARVQRSTRAPIVQFARDSENRPAEAPRNPAH